MWALFGALGGLTAAIAVHDLVQHSQAILRNFPLIGRIFYRFPASGPQRRWRSRASRVMAPPFSERQRQWVYASAAGERQLISFGSASDRERSPAGHLVVKHAMFPAPTPARRTGETLTATRVACAKTIGAARRRRRPFAPPSIVNASSMSFGALSATAVEAINLGCALAGSYQNTGEGGVSRHHRHGGDLIWQIGTGYFGCRDREGRFSLPALCETIEAMPAIRAIEIKLSQGAGSGTGTVLPRAKMTAEIAAIRQVPADVDCVSPPSHSAFRGADSLLDFVESVAAASGLPVGIKSAVGQMWFWQDLARLMHRGDRGVDFVTIEGGEGGAGAISAAFADHASLPFRLGFSRVQHVFAEHGLQDRVVFIGAGRLGFPESAIVAFALGCDAIEVGREALLSLGCVQAMSCHTNRCPTGITTHSPWRSRGLVPEMKSVRLANYLATLRRELLAIAHACGVAHPADVTADMLEMVDDHSGARTVAEVFGGRGVGLPPPRREADAWRLRMQIVPRATPVTSRPADEPSSPPVAKGDDPSDPFLEFDSER